MLKSTQFTLINYWLLQEKRGGGRWGVETKGEDCRLWDTRKQNLIYSPSFPLMSPPHLNAPLLPPLLRHFPLLPTPLPPHSQLLRWSPTNLFEKSVQSFIYSTNFIFTEVERTWDRRDITFKSSKKCQCSKDPDEKKNYEPISWNTVHHRDTGLFLGVCNFTSTPTISGDMGPPNISHKCEMFLLRSRFVGMSDQRLTKKILGHFK